MNITPIPDKGFGAVVTGVRLAELSDDEFAAIRSAWLARGFLLFPEQFLSDAENVAFGERFGELEFGANPMSNSRKQEDGSFGEVFGFRTPDHAHQRRQRGLAHRLHLQAPQQQVRHALCRDGA